MFNHDFINLNCSDGTSMDAYIAFPENEKQFPALLLFQEAFGVTKHIRSVAERLCKKGYAVIAPDLYHRTVKRAEIPYTDFPTADPHRKAITLDGLKTDLAACYDWLIRQSGVQKDKIGSIGFCMGGRVAYYSNAILPLAASVSYYGGGIDLLTDLCPQLHSPQLFFWGGLDKNITDDKISVVINAVKNAGKEFTSVTISNADHGFNCDERASYHPLAAKEAWAHTIAFLDNRLK